VHRERNGYRDLPAISSRKQCTPASVNALHRLASALLSKGVISAGWYSILTGLVLGVVGLALASVSRDDVAAGVVGVVAFLVGAWQLERGLRSEFQRRPRPRGDEF
jgi:tetrahydromethanopterin S-methyltransferase subunit C